MSIVGAKRNGAPGRKWTVRFGTSDRGKRISAGMVVLSARAIGGAVLRRHLDLFRAPYQVRRPSL